MPKSEDFKYKDKWLYYKIPNNYIAVSYISKDQHIHFILLPTVLRLDDFFFEGLGLQQGDGTHSLSDVHVTFTNNNIALISHQITWFNRLGISTEALRFYPEVPPNSDFSEEVKKWKKELAKNNIRNLQFRSPKTTNENVINSLVQIVFHNKLFKISYLYLLNILRCQISEDKKKAIAYLRGIIAAEGCVKLDKTEILGSLKITAVSESVREFYRHCLKTIGINTSRDDLTKGSEAIIITHYDNFKKIYEMRLAELHPEKHQKFINALMKYKQKKLT